MQLTEICNQLILIEKLCTSILRNGSTIALNWRTKNKQRTTNAITTSFPPIHVGERFLSSPVASGLRNREQKQRARHESDFYLVALAIELFLHEVARIRWTSCVCFAHCNELMNTYLRNARTSYCVAPLAESWCIMYKNKCWSGVFWSGF